jgi:hypothetical protein
MDNSPEAFVARGNGIQRAALLWLQEHARRGALVTREVFVVAWSKRSGVDGVDLLAELLRAGLVEVRGGQVTATAAATDWLKRSDT